MTKNNDYYYYYYIMSIGANHLKISGGLKHPHFFGGNRPVLVSVLLYRKFNSEGMRDRFIIRIIDTSWRTLRVEWREAGQQRDTTTTGLYGADAISSLRPPYKIMTRFNQKKRPIHRFGSPENYSPDIGTSYIKR